VLGGGGARGGAHIGVLEVLEDLRVPVDVIAGTSIGAIVGGLFAAGLSADEISSVTQSLDWQELLRGGPPRADIAYRRKQEDARFPVQLELGLDSDGVQLPRGLLTGQSLHLILSGLGIRAGSVLDFDDLPIPFRAIAADLADGTPIPLGEGDFARAIRASMSIPGVFVPVEVGGRLLIDGGISQNVPVSVVLAMGADVVIAVDVATPPNAVEELGTAVAISRQIVRFPIQRATRAQLDLLDADDIVLVPDLTGIGSADFPSTFEAARAGVEAARAATPQLDALALSEVEYAKWQRRVRSSGHSPPIVEAIVLDNRSKFSDRQLGGLIRQEIGAPLDVPMLAEDIARIYGLGFFESVTYRVEDMASDTPSRERGRLIVDIIPEPWGPHFLRFGIGFRDDLGGNSAFRLLASYTMTQLNGWGAEFRNEVEFGRVRALGSEWYQPLGGGGAVFLAARGHYRRTILDVYDRSVRTAQRRRTILGAAADVGLRLGNWGEFRAGVRRGNARLQTRTGVADSVDIDDGIGGVRTSLSIDRLDDRDFPRSGDAFQITLERSIEGFGGSSAYSRFSAHLLHAFSVRSGTILLRLEGGTSLGDSLPPWDELEAGGLFRLSGLRERELTGTDAAGAGLVFYAPVARLPTTLAGGDLLVGVSLEMGNAWAQSEEVRIDDLRVGGSVFLGLETVLGPIQLGYGRADRGQGAWYVFLGRTF